MQRLMSIGSLTVYLRVVNVPGEVPPIVIDVADE